MKLFQKSPKGFTLIELLVVIAIIAILAAMVLISVGGARERAVTTRKAAQISSFRAQAELYYNINGGYGASGTGCAAPLIQDDVSKGSLKKLYDDVITGATPVLCDISPSAWAIAATLSGRTFCADSNGVAKYVVDNNGVDVPLASAINGTTKQCN